MSRVRILIIFKAVAVLAIGHAGCQRPLGSGPAEPSLHQLVEQAMTRELASPPTEVPEMESEPHEVQSADDVLSSLEPRRAELDALSPLPPGQSPAAHAPLGRDLTGNPPQSVQLPLQVAIESAVNRNLAIQFARLQPQITREEYLAAQAIFDAVLFANTDLTFTDQPQTTPVIMGFPLGTPFSRSESYRFETGIRKRFSTGAEAFVSTDLTRWKNLSQSIEFSPDPAYTGAIRVGAMQPLMRGFGEAVNTATIELARTNQQRSAEQFQSDLLELVSNTEQLYWDLDTAWRALAISQWLLDVGVDVRDTMQRRDFDIRPAQYSDAVARVQQRQADVIRAQRAVRVASDALKAVLNDPQIPVSSETVLQPLDEPIETPIAFDLREAILTSVDPSNGRPEVREAALDIEDATIRQAVADNQRLPLLNLSAQAAFYGLDDRPGGAYDDATSGDFIDYLVGLAFEWPIGNRAAEADFNASRLRRSAAAVNYQRTVQQVILDVKNALRDVATNWELIQVTRAFRVAQAENLRTLLVEEELLAGLTPEFLNLKFTRQETLAQARLQESRALADFNKSLATLYRAMGTGLAVRNIRIDIE